MLYLKSSWNSVWIFFGWFERSWHKVMVGEPVVGLHNIVLI